MRERCKFFLPYEMPKEGAKMKRRLTICLVVTALTLVSGAVYAKDVVVGAITSLDNEYYVNWNKGAEQCAEALGLDHKSLVDEASAARQMEIYETQIQAGVKLFFGTSPFTGNIPIITKKVKEANALYVGIWDSVPWYHPMDVGGFHYAAYFAPDDFENAYQLAKAMFKKIGGKGNLAHITGYAGATVDSLRTEGIDKALKEFPEIKLLGRQPGKWTQVESRKVMEDFLVAYPKIDVVYGQNDSEGIGALQAIEDARMKMVPICGMDGISEVMSLIREGRFFGTASYGPGWQAGYAVVRLYDVKHGWKPHPLERMMFTGAALVKKDNVDRYVNYLYGKPKLPFNWTKMSRTLHPEDWDPQNYVWPIDLDYLWGRYKDKKPKGYELPKEYRDAMAKGEFDRIKKMYLSHYKVRIPE